jgi:hypothetical protein
LVNDLFKKQVYVIGAVRSNSSAMPAVFKNCKSRRFQMAQGRQICDRDEYWSDLSTPNIPSL